MIQYKVIHAPTPKELERKVQKMLDDGWTFLGNLVTIPTPPIHSYAREMVKEVKELTAPEPMRVDPAVVDQDFKLRYDRVLSEKTRDLLYINGIVLDCTNGIFSTSYQGETSNGISPIHVLNLLKNSKHFPMDTDEKAILHELEGLV